MKIIKDLLGRSQDPSEEQQVENSIARRERSLTHELNAADEEGRPPEVFFISTEETRMFLRLSHYSASQLLWGRQSIGPLTVLLALQYQEWFENVPVTSSYFNRENNLIYQIFDKLLSFPNEEGRMSPELSEFLKELQVLVDSEKKTYGHLTYQYFGSENSRKELWETIWDHVLKRRTLQGRVPSGRDGKSSEHSSHAKTITVPTRYPPPRIKDFTQTELDNLIGLSTQDRKKILDSG